MKPKKSVLQMLKTFVNERRKAPGRIGVEQYNQALEASEKEIDAGLFTTQEALEKEIENGSSSKKSYMER